MPWWIILGFLIIIGILKLKTKQILKMAGLEEIPINNGAVLNISQIIKAVMSLAAEAELGALFINAKMAVYVQQTLEEFGHSQLRTPIQTNNLTAQLYLPTRSSSRLWRPWICDSIGCGAAARRTNIDCLEARDTELSRLLDQASPSQPPQVFLSPNSDINHRSRISNWSLRRILLPNHLSKMS